MGNAKIKEEIEACLIDYNNSDYETFLRKINDSAYRNNMEVSEFLGYFGFEEFEFERLLMMYQEQNLPVLRKPAKSPSIVDKVLTFLKKTPAQKALEKRKQKEEHLVYEALKQILIFPGSKQEFEELVDYGVFLIDTEANEKGLVLWNNALPFSRYTFDFRKRMVDQSIVGLIHVVPYFSYGHNGWETGRYGLPVGRKKLSSSG